MGFVSPFDYFPTDDRLPTDPRAVLRMTGWNSIAKVHGEQESCSHCIEATRGVTVSTSAFLACHHCYCAGSSLD